MDQFTDVRLGECWDWCYGQLFGPHWTKSGSNHRRCASIDWFHHRIVRNGIRADAHLCWHVRGKVVLLLF